jgi:hypothetical protein
MAFVVYLLVDVSYGFSSRGIDGGLPVKALLLSLQGLANSVGNSGGNPATDPLLYFLYPEDW